MCAVDYFQCLIFGNSQSYDKFVGKPKLVSHPTSSQEILKQQINFYIHIAYHLRGQWHRPISPQTEKNTPFGHLFLPCDMSNSYKAFLSDEKPSPEHISTTPINGTATRCRATDWYWRTHILVYHVFFKTELFLKYKENMGNFCSTSVNPVSDSLEAVPERKR